jgi:hypothetical protein
MSAEDHSTKQVIRGKIANPAPDPFENRWPYIVISLGIVTFICILLGLIFFSFVSSCNASYRVETLADFGEFFGTASALFTGLAFVGVCASIPFLISQVRAARSQVDTAIEQAKISNQQAALADQTNKDSTRQALFIALSNRVGEVIDPNLVRHFPHIDETKVNQQLSQIVEIHTQNDHQFLGFTSAALRAGLDTGKQIPVSDRFRRQSLFRALRSLIAESSEFPKTVVCQRSECPNQ